MYALEPGEPPSRILTWKPLGFLSHIKLRTNDDRFPLSLWEVWFCSTLGVPIPALIGPSQQCACNAFHYDSFGDHLQTCQVTSAASQVHDWVVYRLGDVLGLVGHRVKIHKITSATGKERGDLEIKDYVVLQKPQEQADRLPPPRTLILDFTLTHTRYGWSHVHPIGQLTHTRRSDGALEPDDALRTVARKKILHYRLLKKTFNSGGMDSNYHARPNSRNSNLKLLRKFNSKMCVCVFEKRLVHISNHNGSQTRSRSGNDIDIKLNLLWLMNYRRNRINFIFFVLLVQQRFLFWGKDHGKRLHSGWDKDFIEKTQQKLDFGGAS